MKKSVSNMGRRELLKTLAIGGAATAVVAASSQVLAATPKDAKVSTEEEGSGYRETDHIRRYYATLGRK
ncbi:twin-arginine translocation signal domain-containing protein [Shewanella marina]|uniref:twin-arginine translocation signal domain-containing protein n=1 Tax=Shewanella marina TaxID=487319 RepID=UPI000472F9DE|nr:twin-arginine translocation signal domain-containing protein [Shewanella marina]